MLGYAAQTMTWPPFLNVHAIRRAAMDDQLSTDLQSLRIQRDETPAPRGSGLTWLLVAVLLAGSGAGVYMLLPALSARVFKTDVEVTEVRLVSPAQASVQVTSTGYVAAQVRSRVGAKQSGKVAAVLVREGDVVKAGDVLARLESSDQRNALAVARARAAAARARADAASANVGEVRRQFEREGALAEKGIVGKSTVGDLEARLNALQQAVVAAQSDANAVAAELVQLEANLRDTVITTPIGGVITAKPVDVGEVVGPAMPTLIAEVSDFSSLVVETDVPEARVGLVRMGGPAEIVLDAYPTRRMRGTVTGLSPKVNRAKATVVVKVKFNDDTQGVLPDMSARVSFLENRLDESVMKEVPRLFVPGGAVTDRDGEKVVFRVVDGKARQERVRLGPPMAGGFELQQGPGDGTKLINKPPTELSDGYPIKEKSR